jgi:hypothetical protein
MVERSTQEPVKKKLSDQQKLVLDYLDKHPYITCRTSILALGIIDLRKRISELRRLGYDIEDRTVKTTNYYGKKIAYKEYYIQKGEQNA